VAEAGVVRGVLPRPGGTRIYWERFGTGPVPALFLHGGPGSGLAEHHRSYFDPTIHAVFGMDQRGCGRSSPSAADDLDSLATNTTAALLEDVEALRRRHDVERWLVVGLSWGATLALAYAEQHPERVTALVLGAVTTTSTHEVAWITEDLRHVFPRQWDRLAEAAAARPGERLVDALYRGITSRDAGEREATAVAWAEWEDVHGSLDPNFPPAERWQDPHTRLEVATLVLHYWSLSAFLGDAGILEGVDRLSGIPGVLVHGRRDLASGMSVPWDLHRRWPGSELQEIPEEGHFGPEIFRGVRDAVSRLSGNPARILEQEARGASGR
jgi:proline iminopeptidase